MTDTSRRSILSAAAATVPLFLAGAASAQSAGGEASDKSGAGRTAIVTGSSRGIGAATAKRLAHDGYSVTINYLTNRRLAEGVVSDIKAAGGKAIVVQADVADPTQVKALFDAHHTAFGNVDVVVSNAGIMNVGLFAQVTDDAFDRMIATNIKGSFNVLREAARRIRDGGRIVSLSSSITRQVPPGAGAYAATKAAQDMYVKSLAQELAGRGIAVNAIAPGAVDTQLLRQHGEAAISGIPALTAMRRLGTPEDIAGVIAMLCSSDGAWIDGQTVFANGGLG